MPVGGAVTTGLSPHGVNLFSVAGKLDKNMVLHPTRKCLDLDQPLPLRGQTGGPALREPWLGWHLYLVSELQRQDGATTPNAGPK